VSSGFADTFAAGTGAVETVESRKSKVGSKRWKYATEVRSDG
jgi:hypothetical protein